MDANAGPAAPPPWCVSSTSVANNTSGMRSTSSRVARVLHEVRRPVSRAVTARAHECCPRLLANCCIACTESLWQSLLHVATYPYRYILSTVVRPSNIGALGGGSILGTLAWWATRRYSWSSLQPAVDRISDGVFIRTYYSTLPRRVAGIAIVSGNGGGCSDHLSPYCYVATLLYDSAALAPDISPGGPKPSPRRLVISGLSFLSQFEPMNRYYSLSPPMTATMPVEC
jgi:hypothetical protein